MSSKEKKWITRERILFVITILMFLLTFTGIRYRDVVTYWRNWWSPEPFDIITSWDDPEGFYNEIYVVSPEYYVEQKITITDDTISYDQQLKFKVSFDNRGKQIVEKPRLVIFITDANWRLWAGYDTNLTADQLAKKILLHVKLPTEDKKILGQWRIVSLLYDDATLSLTSYCIAPFSVVETDRGSFIFQLSGMIILILLMTTIYYISERVAEVRARELLKRKDAENNK